METCGDNKSFKNVCCISIARNTGESSLQWVLKTDGSVNDINWWQILVMAKICLFKTVNFKLHLLQTNYYWKQLNQIFGPSIHYPQNDDLLLAPTNLCVNNVIIAGKHNSKFLGWQKYCLERSHKNHQKWSIKAFVCYIKVNTHYIVIS